ncbi:hypothetical protein CBM2589_B120359 [Cupriavidus taiwanensis]|uniref:Uncharacterized protein n=1 Tax=Cupriavidus taiwanensis TaxID=164546 RepID=A0A975WUI2_9BURK|nr:hypothetical protein CBM2589_B120359 [Cupriavidus taiwanensis]
MASKTAYAVTPLASELPIYDYAYIRS